MSEGQRCPTCGSPLSLPQTQGRSVNAAIVESLTREVQYLRETVALLRGSAAQRPAGLVSPSGFGSQD